MDTAGQTYDRGTGDAPLLLECCRCKGLLHDPVLLDCLHSCCRPCFKEGCSGGRGSDPAAATASQTFACPDCSTVSEASCSSISNDFLRAYELVLSLKSGLAHCRFCLTEDGKPSEWTAAEVWCMQCRECLCCECLAWHNRFHERHRVALLDDVRDWSVSRLFALVTSCPLHGCPVTLLCSDCRSLKCSLCTAEPCAVLQHKARPIESVRAATGAIDSALGRLSGRLSSLLSKVRYHLEQVRARRKDGSLDLLDGRKRRLVDALEHGYDKSVHDIFIASEASEAACSTTCRLRRLLMSSEFAGAYCSQAIEHADSPCLVLQKSCLNSRLRSHVGTVESSTMALRVTIELNAVRINSVLPPTTATAAAAWIGWPQHEQVLQKSFSFAPACNRFQSPVPCLDLAVTSEGRLLLAALRHGLKEHSWSEDDSRWRELSSWKPPRQADSGEDDEVWAVEALDDGRAAVGVGNARLVVLLRRSAAGSWWQEDRRVVKLQYPPWLLSVYRDLIAVTECRLDDEHEGRLSGPWLQLVTLSTGRQLCRQKRPYSVWGMAVTALAIVTASYGTVKLSSEREAWVVASHSHRGDILWTRELGDGEAVVGVCTEPTGSILYLAVLELGSGRSRDCVRAIRGKDGETTKEVVGSSSHGLKLPARLALGHGRRMILAVLSSDEAGRQWETLTVYSARAETA